MRDLAWFWDGLEELYVSALRVLDMIDGAVPGTRAFG